MVSFQAAFSSLRSHLGAGVLQAIQMDLRDRLVDHRGGDAASTAKSRLECLQLLPIAGLSIGASQQQQTARVLLFHRFELLERRNRRLQLLVLEQDFGLHDERGRAAIGSNFQRALQILVATFGRALQVGRASRRQIVSRRALGFAHVTSQRGLGGFPVPFGQLQDALSKAATRAFMASCLLSGFPRAARGDRA